MSKLNNGSKKALDDDEDAAGLAPGGDASDADLEDGEDEEDLDSWELEEDMEE